MQNIITLDNGLRIVYENMSYSRAISFGIWIGAGSCREEPCNNGVSHLIEHMLFKGTKKKDAKDIAIAMDEIGGQINAFTGTECTCIYGKTLDQNIDKLFDILTDMFFNSTYDKDELILEKNVVLEEISMCEDTPEELVHDVLNDMSWGKHSLGYPILGTKNSLQKINRDVILDYIKNVYKPENVVLAFSGNIDGVGGEKALESMVKENFGSWKAETLGLKPIKKAMFTPITTYRHKDIEQVHVALGFEGLANNASELYTLLALNNILGGGLSSRLFQKIREEKGLAYSVYSYPSAYSYGGMFNIYAGTNPECFDEVLRLIAVELSEIKAKGVIERELERTKEQMKSNYILSLENVSDKMNSMGKSLLILNEIKTQENILKSIDEITLSTVKGVIDRIFDFDRVSMAVVGEVEVKRELKDFL